MTIEEAIKELSVLWERMERAKESGVLAYKTIMYYDGQYVEALDMAIQALEQTDVLDKIKVEIDLKQYDFMGNKDYDEGIRFGLMLAYQIIDKYKSESKIEQALAYADQDTLMPAT